MLAGLWPCSFMELLCRGGVGLAAENRAAHLLDAVSFTRCMCCLVGVFRGVSCTGPLGPARLELLLAAIFTPYCAAGLDGRTKRRVCKQGMGR